MNQLLLCAAPSLFAVGMGVPITSAGVLDLHGHPPAAGSPFIGSTFPGMHRPSPAEPQHVIQQTSLRTVIQISSNGAQRYVYTYAPDGRFETERLQSHRGGMWFDSLRTTRTYAPAGMVKSEYVEQYLLGAFRSLSRWSLEYNEAGDVISSLSERGNWVLEPSSRSLSSYASPGRRSSLTYQSWSGSWSNNSRESSTWNGDGQMAGGTYEQWIEGRWDTTGVTVISYVSGILNEVTYRTRNKGDGGWRDSSVACFLLDDAQNTHCFEQRMWTNGVLSMAVRTTNTFDPSGRIMRSMDEEELQGVMTPIQRVTFTYDHQGNQLKRVRESFDGGLWHPRWQLASTYDGSGNVLTCKVEEWAGSGWIPSAGASVTDAYAGVTVVDAAGNWTSFHRFATLTFDYGSGATDVPGGEADRPLTLTLSQNYPNPFNPSTMIRYGVPERTYVTLSVFNPLGQQVAVLQHGEVDAGYHEVRFDAGDLASGVYFYRLSAGSFMETKKFLLVR